jgi:hypothetical protein
MGTRHPEITSDLRAFIEAQPLFFVATAPRALDGHINLSPKGLDSLRVVGPAAVAYLDHVGSGAETIAHLRDNGRIVIMMCAFSGSPRIVRLHGRGRVVEPQDAGYERLRRGFPDDLPGGAVIYVDIERVSDSCGYGVPLMTLTAHRTQLARWTERKGPDGLRDYQVANNRVSIDGLPALRWTGSDQPGDNRVAGSPPSGDDAD